MSDTSPLIHANYWSFSNVNCMSQFRFVIGVRNLNQNFGPFLLLVLCTMLPGLIEDLLFDNHLVFNFKQNSFGDFKFSKRLSYTG